MGRAPAVRFKDLGQAMKDNAVVVKSEKLPVAFGPMSLQYETTRKIFLNLQACPDCHAVLKLLWKITGSKVVFSDSTRGTGLMGLHLNLLHRVIVAVFYCFLKQLAEYSDTDHETILDQDARRSETEPILPRKEVVVSYGATEEQPESSMFSAEDLYSEKVCKICYDAARSCFFIPCGHGFTCFACARRIVEGENKACPICRRLIHRVRRLESP